MPRYNPRYNPGYLADYPEHPPYHNPSHHPMRENPERVSDMNLERIRQVFLRYKQFHDVLMDLDFLVFEVTAGVAHTRKGTQAQESRLGELRSIHNFLAKQFMLELAVPITDAYALGEPNTAVDEVFTACETALDKMFLKASELEAELMKHRR